MIEVNSLLKAQTLEIWVWIPPLSLTSFVNMEHFSNISVAQFPHVTNVDNILLRLGALEKIK